MFASLPIRLPMLPNSPFGTIRPKLLSRRVRDVRYTYVRKSKGNTISAKVHDNRPYRQDSRRKTSPIGVKKKEKKNMNTRCAVLRARKSEAIANGIRYKYP